MLGSMLQPFQASEDSDSLRAKWDGFMSNPVNRAFMMGTGLQLMTGGHGSATQQAAVALGQGAQSAGNVEQQMVAERDKETALGEKEADRQLKRDLNEETTSARLEAVGLRGQFAAELAAARGSKDAIKADTLAKLYTQQVNKIREEESFKKVKLTEEQIAERAEREALRAYQFATGGAQGKTGSAAKETSGKSPLAQGPQGQPQPQKAGEKPAAKSTLVEAKRKSQAVVDPQNRGPASGIGQQNIGVPKNWEDVVKTQKSETVNRILTNPELYNRMKQLYPDMPAFRGSNGQIETP